MRLKLDENIGARGADLLQRAGHDVSTVADQRLTAATDTSLIEVCRAERRCLVTLDLEFGNPLLFKPSEFSGIAVLRFPRKPTPQDLLEALQTVVGGLARGSIDGKLWIVQRGRIREYQEEARSGND